MEYEFKEVPRIFRYIENEDANGLKKCLEEGDNPNVEHEFVHSPHYTLETREGRHKYLTKEEFDEINEKISENNRRRAQDRWARLHDIPKLDFGRPSTPLVHAVLQGNPELVKILLEHRADPNQKIGNRQKMAGEQGYFLTGNPETTPLYTASHYRDSTPQKDDKYLRIVKLLLRHGAKTDIKVNGTTPIHGSANFGLYKLVQLMVKAGGKTAVNQTTETGRTPLMIAAGGPNHTNPKLVKYLIGQGADLDAVDSKRESALHQVVIGISRDKSKLDALKQLLKAGANPLVQDEKGRTPSYYVSKAYVGEKYNDRISEARKILTDAEEAAKK